MKIRIRGLRLPLDYQGEDLKQEAARRLELAPEVLESLTLVKKAIDARRRTVFFTCTVDLKLARGIEPAPQVLDSPEISLVEDKKLAPLVSGNNPLNYSPIVVGAGPAGLFCALLLARRGYRPVVIEQGEDIDRRIKSVEQFWRDSLLKSYSNTQFGEGGAGTFSDGKLTTRIGDPRVDFILDTLVEFGADPEILYLKKPHVGTDLIREIVKKIRREVIRLGGEFYFGARLTDINVNLGSLKSIIINNEAELPCSLLVLAVGNSAREVYRMLYRKGVSLIPKAFAIGVRVEHPQKIIDRMQYGSFAGHPRLPAADYHLSYKDGHSGRSLYTFCMCPGGYVVAAASGEGQLVTNGMSYSQRDSGIANSALVVTVSPNDWDHQVLGGIELQEGLEHKAFELGGGDYRAPAQYLQDFLVYRASTSLEGSIATYRPGVTPANLWKILPQEVAELIKRGIQSWTKRLDGFVSEQVVLTGVETRTSAPLRILRESGLESVSIPGLYPCGEGAGYAGGIVSAAVDGVKVAEKIISHYRGPLAEPTFDNSQMLKGSELE